ncbi:MAG: hypothetical protein ABJH68_21495 [Ilumatobacter sp.]|uniref:hypothetical protein n=1 Tax=Ilumatobacter sp. TaxID=1967498 RepID=UPI003297F2DE
MTHHTDIEPVVDPNSRSDISRRTLLGAGALIGGAGLISLGQPGHAHALPAADGAALLAPTIDGLTYVTLDAFAFDVAGVSPAAYRLYQQTTGMQPQPAPGEIHAPLPIPIGSVVKQINVGFLGQPIVAITRRQLTGGYTDLTTLTTLTAGGGVKTQTLAVDGELTHGASYAVRAFCSAGASVLGMTIGYIPPAQAFIPYSGTEARVLDTRTGVRFDAGEERVVDLSGRIIATARAAVVNVTAVGVGGRGFLSVYRDGIAFPGTSSVNYTAPGQTVANGVITAVSAGRIKVRAGDTSTHVLVDVIGSLL